MRRVAGFGNGLKSWKTMDLHSSKTIMSRADQIPMTFSQALNIDRCSHRPPQLAPPFLLKHVWNAHLDVYWSCLKPTCIIWVDNSHWAPEVHSISIHFQNHKWKSQMIHQIITIHWQKKIQWPFQWPFQWHRTAPGPWSWRASLATLGRWTSPFARWWRALPRTRKTRRAPWIETWISVDLRGSSWRAPRGCDLGMPMPRNATV